MKISDSTIRAGLRLLRDVVAKALRSAQRRDPAPARPQKNRSKASDYPGDYQQRPDVSYAPRNDERADPGEIVWTWVPFEEDYSQGKDRPVLIIGQDGPWLLALQVTSQDHDRDAAQEASQGRYWHDIGTGAWDRQGRPSEVRLNRIIRIDPNKVRRIGAVLDRERFEAATMAMMRHY